MKIRRIDDIHTQEIATTALAKPLGCVVRAGARTLAASRLLASPNRDLSLWISRAFSRSSSKFCSLRSISFENNNTWLLAV